MNQNWRYTFPKKFLLRAYSTLKHSYSTTKINYSSKMKTTLCVLIDILSVRVKTNALISSHPGGLTPGTYGRIGRDLLTFVANVWPGTGALNRFCTSEGRYTGKDPQDL